MTHNVRDLIIVGGGPAGLSAALYASRSMLDAVTFEREALGARVEKVSQPSRARSTTTRASRMPTGSAWLTRCDSRPRTSGPVSR